MISNHIINYLSQTVRKFTSTSAARMRLLQFNHNGSNKVGVELQENGDIAELPSPKYPSDMVSLLKGGEKLLNSVKSELLTFGTVQRDKVKILSPITNPEKVICVGMNYVDHCKEQNAPIPEEPIIFSKFPSAITGPYDDIVLPKLSDSVDWEVELVIVIGKEGKAITRSEAMDYVAGFTIANDVSARDWQMKRNGRQWLLGKTFDTFCPLGPVLMTKDSISDVHNLNLKCLVNGVVMQDSNTNQLVFKTEEIIEWVSAIFTIKPGDIILTGTPPGVGVFRKPPIYLKHGDVVTCEIAELGKITNNVVAE